MGGQGNIFVEQEVLFDKANECISSNFVQEQVSKRIEDMTFAFFKDWDKYPQLEKTFIKKYKKEKTKLDEFIGAKEMLNTFVLSNNT